MNHQRRKDLHLSLTGDQFDDLISALENHRDNFQRMAEEALNGFGLGEPYWGARVHEIQELIDMVQQLVRDEGAK